MAVSPIFLKYEKVNIIQFLNSIKKFCIRKKIVYNS